MLNITLVQTGSAAEAVQAEFGDFPDFFRASLSDRPVRWQCFSADAPRATWPEPSRAVVVTGSPRSVLDDLPWANTLGAWLDGAAASGAHVLGVCFGHQFLAQHLGGRVDLNPAGYEIGAVSVRPAEIDGAPDPIASCLQRAAQEGAGFYALHQDAVMALPVGAVVLGRNEFGLQAARFSPRVWGVQFHPEFRPEIMRKYLAVRAERVLASAKACGRSPDEAMRGAEASLARPDAGRSLLEAFVDEAIRHQGEAAP